MCMRQMTGMHKGTRVSELVGTLGPVNLRGLRQGYAKEQAKIWKVSGLFYNSLTSKMWCLK